MDTLFDHPRPSSPREPDHFVGDYFKFQNSSDEPSICELRARLEDWYSRIGDRGYREQLRTRFRGGNERYLTAVSELVVHQICKAHGYEVDYHVGEGRVPDFLVEISSEANIFIEVVSLAERSREENQQKTIAKRYENWASELGLQGTGLFFTITRVDTAKLRKAEWQQFVRRQIESFQQSGECEGRGKVYGQRPEQFLLLTDSMSIEGFVTVGGDPEDAMWVSAVQLYDANPMERIRDSIHKKRPSVYGFENQPYLIAVVLPNSFINPGQFGAALYGDMKWRVSIGGGSTKDMGHIYDGRGLWISGSGFKNTRVSGVLAVAVPDLLHLDLGWAAVFQHPEASSPLPNILERIPRIRLGQNGQIEPASESLASLLL